MSISCRSCALRGCRVFHARRHRHRGAPRQIRGGPGEHHGKIDTTTSLGRFFFTTIAALAQLERDQISERTCMALAHKRSKRQRVSGQIPYGSRLAPDGVTLVDEPQEQRAVAIVRRLRAAGGTTRDIEKELQRLGLRPRNGWHWPSWTCAGGGEGKCSRPKCVFGSPGITAARHNAATRFHGLRGPFQDRKVPT